MPRKIPKRITTSAKQAIKAQLKRLREESKRLQKLREGNPSETIKSGEWTPAHAVRIRNGKLEILR